MRTSIALVAATVAVTVGASPAAWAAPELPAPDGHPVGVTQLHLVDGSRTDPWTHAGRRELAVSAFYPARRTAAPRARWVSRPVADALADGFQIPAAPLRAIRIHAKADAPARSGRFPVVLLSPGAAMPRATVTLAAEDLAAHGYLVLMIDHPGDAAAVELSGGRIRLIDPGFLAGFPDVTDAVRIRTDDARFVLDRLRDIDAKGILRHRLDRERIAIAGHSIGGSTGANVMLADDRVDVGVNYDGDYFLAAATTAPARPFMTLTGGADENQRAFFARQPRGGLLVTLAGAEHDSFTDLSYLESVFEGPVMPVEIGTIAPDAALAAQRAYTRAFLDHHLRGRPASPLLTHATSAQHPAVTVEVR